MSTLYFPQLADGALVQYPVTRHWLRPVTVNSLPDGSTVTMVSPAPPRVSWQFGCRGLSSTEWLALQTLFSASQGRYGTFTFLDPTDNLLTWSEDPTEASWAADPLLQITKGIADTKGGSGAAMLTNSGQAAARLIQSVAGPSWFQYCFSIYLQAQGSCTVSLIRSSASAQATQIVNVTSNWTRAYTSGALAAQDDGLQFGLELAAGASVCMFGAQVEAQPSAGVYKYKANNSGVYTKSRFNQDTLVQTTDTSGQYSTTIQIAASY